VPSVARRAFKKLAATNPNRRKSPKSKSVRKNSTAWLLAYVGILMVTAVVAAITAQGHRQPIAADPFSSEQRGAVSFALYYPSQLPGSLHVERSSLGQVQSNIVNMRIVGRGSDDALTPASTPGSGDSLNISVSQQPVPAGFDMGTFLRSFGSPKEVKTRVGTATYGIIGNADGSQSYLASVVTSDKTWILVQAPASTNTADLEAILKGLVASPRQLPQVHSLPGNTEHPSVAPHYAIKTL